MNSFEHKQIEGQRIMPALGAIGAIPGAGLIGMGPNGAPLFAAALIFLGAAYALWVFTDRNYNASTAFERFPVLLRELRAGHPGAVAFRKQLIRVGYTCQWGMLIFAAVSVICSLLGFTAEHAGVRLPVSIEAGFAVDIGLAVIVLALVLTLNHAVNQVTHSLSELMKDLQIGP